MPDRVYGECYTSGKAVIIPPSFVALRTKVVNSRQPSPCHPAGTWLFKKDMLLVDIIKTSIGSQVKRAQALRNSSNNLIWHSRRKRRRDCHNNKIACLSF